MGYETLLYEKDPDDKFVVVTINRPDKLNALSKTVVHELNQAVAQAVADENVNAMLLTGAGRAFSTGYDLNGADYDVDVEVWRADMTENCEQ
ncbi:MAG: enoyl-CoA hydratase/isomerase family protein, partial [Anaerolineales bacterium]|nr:enoyl-CoA hydratase/isomerase family protein [Anaerolineales bacterium]